MAEACYENARKLQLDSLALKKRKSPGHAYSLLILSVEEAVKAIVYRLAADGIMKIIGEEEPEEPFSIRQKDLLNHSMKHEILGGIIVSSIMYSPFSTAFDDIQCGNIKVNEAKRRIVKSIANHQALLMDLKDLNSQISRWIRRFTDCLSVLNHEKNLGFYVSYEDSKIIRPNEVPAKRYHYWLEFSKDWLSLTDEIVRSGIGEEQISSYKTISTSNH